MTGKDQIELIDTAAGPARLKRTRRKTLAISVLPDGGLELTAPESASVEAIRQKVTKRHRWIREQRRTFGQMNAERPAPRYITGATHRYLGRQYRLKIEPGCETRVVLKGAYLHIQLPEVSEEAAETALGAWYKDRAHEQFERRLEAWASWCRNRGLPEPRLQLRSMAKRWGSAHRNGTIVLNPRLIRAPSVCVDYVIAHEICHLQYPHHGREFKMLLRQLLPDAEKRKERLEGGEW